MVVEGRKEAPEPYLEAETMAICTPALLNALNRFHRRKYLKVHVVAIPRVNIRGPAGIRQFGHLGMV